ncbi:glycosyltransferase family 2 protein [Pollutibacter soli]|uniref:glycosyltransferase family 2 protein n=1 Tax=Pollutibacter soli TaxID=3034157 RepID=UPI0030140E73
MFSVLIPAFKEKYLRKALESVLAQSYKDFEVIIVNDKSPENIAKVVYNYDDPRVRYFENEVNLGKENVVFSWNKCLSYATREFCILFSDDDVLHPEFLQEISNLIKKYPEPDLFYTRTAIIGKNDEIIRYSPSAPELETVHDFVWHRVYGMRDLFAQNFVFRRSALLAMKGFVELPLAWATDDATWFSLARKNGVVASSRVLCFWRWSELNISNIGNSMLRFKAIETYYKWLQEFVQNLDESNDFKKGLKNEILQNIPVKKKEAFEYIIERNLSNKGAFHTMSLFIKARNMYDIPAKTLVKLNVKKMMGRQ